MRGKDFAKSFVPVQSVIMVEADDTQFAIKTDRPQAGTVHKDGTIKLLIDRRIISMDAGGIGDEHMFVD